VSLLEIMVSLCITTIVIIAFAAVFPGGYRLNYANLNQNKASSLAASVAEEIRARSLPELRLCESMTPQQMQTAHYFNTRVPTGLTSSKDIPVSASELYEFYIPFANGIVVTRSAWTDASGDSVENFTIQVTVNWAETRKRTRVLRSVSVVSMYTSGLERSL